MASQISTTPLVKYCVGCYKNVYSEQHTVCTVCPDWRMCNSCLTNRHSASVFHEHQIVTPVFQNSVPSPQLLQIQVQEENAHVRDQFSHVSEPTTYNDALPNDMSSVTVAEPSIIRPVPTYMPIIRPQVSPYQPIFRPPFKHNMAIGVQPQSMQIRPQISMAIPPAQHMQNQTLHGITILPPNSQIRPPPALSMTPQQEQLVEQSIRPSVAPVVSPQQPRVMAHVPQQEQPVQQPIVSTRIRSKSGPKR